MADDDVEKEAKKNNHSWVAEINFCRLSPLYAQHNPQLSLIPNDRNLLHQNRPWIAFWLAL